MSKLKVSTQLSILIGTLLLLMVGMAAIGLWSNGRANEALKSVYEDRTVPVQQIGDIQQSFLVLNAGLRQASLGKHLDAWRDQMDPVLVSRLEIAANTTAVDVARAEVERTAYHQRLVAFFEQYDVLLLPTSATPPLPLDVQFPIEVGGRSVRQPIDMLLPTYAFNFSNFPAISVPAGWTDDGLPVGLQIVGGWQQDTLVLRAAAAFEEARPWADYAAGAHYYDNLAVLKMAEVPAVLLEAGVIVNRREELLLAQEHRRTRMAGAIARGILDCLPQ